MGDIAACLLFDRDGALLIYLRDDKPTIPFPNHWDLFGGHIEAGEEPEEALRRELEEELRVRPTAVKFWRAWEVTEGDVVPHTKYLYVAWVAEAARELTLYEGQELRGIAVRDWQQYRFANVQPAILAAFEMEAARFGVGET